MFMLKKIQQIYVHQDKKTRAKSTFASISCNVLLVKKFWQNIKKLENTVKLKKSLIKFKNHFKQLTV